MLEYNRDQAVLYALYWALDRNPQYYNFTGIGGDCTNFISQSVYAGSGVMNFTPTFGWYYISVNDRAPAWTGVEYFYNFMTTNKGPGPFGEEVELDELQLGDVVQFNFYGDTFTHGGIITRLRPFFSGDRRILISAHSNDARNRSLSTYEYQKVRGIHIIGVGEPY
ncbi:MAG: amidase domain-containing protein [Monoglobales bacterium]